MLIALLSSALEMDLRRLRFLFPTPLPGWLLTDI